MRPKLEGRLGRISRFFHLFLVFLFFFLLNTLIVQGVIVVVAPEPVSIVEVPPPVVVLPGDPQVFIGPNSTSAVVQVYGSSSTTLQLLSNPNFTGTPEPWFYAENDWNGYVGPGYDAGNGYAYMVGEIPRSFWWQATSYILQRVYVPATSAVYGSLDWAYTLSANLRIGRIVLFVVVFDENWSLTAASYITRLMQRRNSPAWSTFDYNFSGQLPGPGTYYVGIAAVWYGDLFRPYTASIYVDNFYLYVDDPSLHGLVLEDNALRINNLHNTLNWTARLRVDAYSYSGSVDWLNVTLMDVLGNEASPEISFSSGLLVSNETGGAALTYSGSLRDTLYLEVRGRLGSPGAFLELNMTLVLDSGTGVVLEYPVVVRAEQP